MANGLRYETGRDMPPGMQELAAKKLVQIMQQEVNAPPGAGLGEASNNERRIIVENTNMSAKVSLEQIKDGGIFSIAGMKFIKFPSENGKTPIVMKEFAFQSEFGENNDLRKSHVLQRIEMEILPNIVAAVANDLCDIKTDLISLDGLKPYGVLESLITLPTLDFYRANVAIFDRNKVSGWWWLATPDSASPHGDSQWVMCVHADGFVGNYNGRTIEFGVRPMLCLKSTALVDVEA